MDERFRHNKYTIRRNYLGFSGNLLKVLDPQGFPIFGVKQKGFSVRGEFKLFDIEGSKSELLSIKNRKLSGAEYEVIDLEAGESVGVLKRRPIEAAAALGLIASAIAPLPLRSDPFSNRDWLILDTFGLEAGVIKVETPPGPFWRRINFNFPKLHKVYLHQNEVASYLRENRILTEGIIVDIETDHDNVFDRRLSLAAAVLIMNVRS